MEENGAARQSDGWPGLTPHSRLTAAERDALRERAEAARAVAAAAILRYSTLLVQAAYHLHEAQNLTDTVIAARDELRERVAHYAVLLKHLDTTPEQTLRIVKATVNESALRAETQVVMNDVVQWCIEAYYGGSTAA